MKKYTTVAEFIDDLDDQKRLQVNRLREIILSASPELEEHIKWNAPSYLYQAEDRITFNLINKEGLVKIVLHMGALRKENTHGDPVMNDSTGLIVWASDIRGTISFNSLEDINSHATQLVEIFKQWLAIKLPDSN